MRPDSLPSRRGPRPLTDLGPPHVQLDQWSSQEMCDALRGRCLELPHVRERVSRIARAGTCALWLPGTAARGPKAAFLHEGEFAHLHGPPGCSLHITLPDAHREAALRRGWVERHPIARAGMLPPTLVLVYAPRDSEELEVAFQLVQVSYRFARGELDSAGNPRA